MGVSCDKTSKTTRLLHGPDDDLIKHALMIAAKHHSHKSRFQYNIRKNKIEEHKALSERLFKMATRR